MHATAQLVAEQQVHLLIPLFFSYLHSFNANTISAPGARARWSQLVVKQQVKSTLLKPIFSPSSLLNSILFPHLVYVHVTAQLVVEQQVRSTLEGGHGRHLHQHLHLLLGC